MILTKDDYQLPQWVRDNIMMKCKYCGADIASNHDTGVLTERWCTNPYCPGHMSYKMDYIGKYYDVKGFGPKLALEWIQNHNAKSHLEILPQWFPNEKPTEALARIVDLCCIKEFGMTQGEPVLNKYASFEEFFASDESKFFPVLIQAHDFLCDSQKYFNVKRPLLGKVVNIMITGSVEGFTNREDYVDYLNEKFGDKIHVIQVGRRKSNVAALIQDPGAVSHSKTKVAKEAGIPILTSRQFIEVLIDSYKECGGDMSTLISE